MIQGVEKKFIFLSLHKQGYKSTNYVIYTLCYTQKRHCLRKVIAFLLL